MRDTLLLVFVLASLIVAFRYPFAGLLIWAWFTLMTPHQLVYGTFGVPVNMLIAGVTMGSIFVNGAYAQFRPDRMIGLFVLFIFWLFVSQHYSVDPANSALFFDRFYKTMLFIILCGLLATSRLRIHALLWCLVLAIGFFAAKGALFTIATFGQYRVQGIEETILYDNNHMALAIATTLPLMVYLRGQLDNKLLKTGLLIVFCLSIFAILGTHSRGGLICLLVFGGYFWLRSRYKFAIACAFMFLAIPAIAFMPSKWTERMSTITNASEDASFMGRVDAWEINTELAKKNPFTGVGLRNAYQVDIAKTAVDKSLAERARAAHSIYFEILGGTGFVGLMIFLSILLAGFWGTVTLQQKSSEPDSAWMGDFGRYAQISIVVFCIGGSAASMEMWDGYLLIIALVGATVRLKHAARRGEITTNAAARLRWRMKARGYGKRAARRLKPAASPSPANSSPASPSIQMATDRRLNAITPAAFD